MTGVAKLDYSEKDYSKILDQLKEKIPDLTTEWNDFIESDIGWAIIQLFAGLADFNTFYLDRQAAETYLSTCSKRDSAVSISKMLGYTPQGTSSSYSEVTFNITNQYNENIIIPSGLALKIDSINFFTDDSATILEGDLSTTVKVIQGELFRNKLISPGLKWYKITLPKNISDIVVFVDGDEWEKVDSFIYSVNPKCYKITEDKSGRRIEFGGGITASIPEANSVIIVTGVLSEGKQGNVLKSNIPVEILNLVYNSGQVDISDLLYGVMGSPAINGEDLEDIDSIKDNAPAFYTTQNRVTSASDYEIVAKLVNGVVGVSAWGGEEVERYGESFVCVYGVDPLEVPESLLNEVREVFEAKRLIPIIVNVIAPSPILANIECDAYAYKFSNLSTVISTAEQNITEFISSLNIGEMLQISDLINIISSDSDVDYTNVRVSLRKKSNLKFGVIDEVLIDHINEESITITNLSNEVLWKHGDSEYTYFNNILYIPFNDEKLSEEVHINFISKYNDVYPIRDQLIVIDDLTVRAYERKFPEGN